jgi:hypothetical protein
VVPYNSFQNLALGTKESFWTSHSRINIITWTLTPEMCLGLEPSIELYWHHNVELLVMILWSKQLLQYISCGYISSSWNCLYYHDKMLNLIVFKHFIILSYIFSFYDF